MSRIYVVLGFAILLFSCNKNKEILDKKVVFNLAQVEDKVFFLDNETTYNRIRPYLKTLNDSLFFIFMNRDKNQFYLYDYASGDLVKKINVYKEGPHAVKGNFFSYYFHNLDSIFINPWHTIKYIINAQGEVVNKVEIIDNSEHLFGNENLNFDGATIFKNGKLLTGRRVTVPEANASNPIRTSFDFNTGTFENNFLEEKMIVPDYDAYTALIIEMAKSNGVSTMDKLVVGTEDQLFASSEINDSIYEFSKGQLVKAYYAGDPSIETADYLAFHDKTQVESTANSVSIFSKAVQPPHYTSMFMDQEKKWVYRILIHGTKDSKGKNDFRDAKIIGASLIAFNVASQTSTAFELPIDEIHINTYTGNYFATKEGVHFPIEEQEIESEKRYKVFKVE